MIFTQKLAKFLNVKWMRKHTIRKESPKVLCPPKISMVYVGFMKLYKSSFGRITCYQYAIIGGFTQIGSIPQWT